MSHAAAESLALLGTLHCTSHYMSTQGSLSTTIYLALRSIVTCHSRSTVCCRTLYRAECQEDMKRSSAIPDYQLIALGSSPIRFPCVYRNTAPREASQTNPWLSSDYSEQLKRCIDSPCKCPDISMLYAPLGDPQRAEDQGQQRPT